MSTAETRTGVIQSAENFYTLLKETDMLLLSNSHIQQHLVEQDLPLEIPSEAMIAFINLWNLAFGPDGYIDKNDVQKQKELLMYMYRITELAHVGQKRKTREFYSNHVVRSAYRMAESQQTVEVIAGTMGHDIIEDSKVVTKDILKDLLKDYPDIFEDIEALTKVKDVVKKIKKEETEKEVQDRKQLARELALVKILDVGMDHPEVFAAKFKGDRRDNLETLYGHSDPKREYPIALDTYAFSPVVENVCGFSYSLTDQAFFEVDAKSWGSYERMLRIREGIINNLEAIELSQVAHSILNIDSSYKPSAVYITIPGIHDVYQESKQHHNGQSGFLPQEDDYFLTVSLSMPLVSTVSRHYQQIFANTVVMHLQELWQSEGTVGYTEALEKRNGENPPDYYEYTLRYPQGDTSRRLKIKIYPEDTFLEAITPLSILTSEHPRIKQGKTEEPYILGASTSFQQALKQFRVVTSAPTHNYYWNGEKYFTVQGMYTSYFTGKDFQPYALYIAAYNRLQKFKKRYEDVKKRFEVPHQQIRALNLLTDEYHMTVIGMKTGRKGKITETAVRLSQNATALDYALTYLPGSFHRIVSIEVNGNEVPLDHQLQPQDKISCKFADEGEEENQTEPSWLSMVQTAPQQLFLLQEKISEKLIYFQECAERKTDKTARRILQEKLEQYIESLRIIGAEKVISFTGTPPIRFRFKLLQPLLGDSFDLSEILIDIALNSQSTENIVIIKDAVKRFLPELTLIRITTPDSTGISQSILAQFSRRGINLVTEKDSSPYGSFNKATLEFWIDKNSISDQKFTGVLHGIRDTIQRKTQTTLPENAITVLQPFK